VIQDEGKCEEAELNRRVLAAKEKVLGPEHPSILASIGNLAEMFGTRAGTKRPIK